MAENGDCGDEMKGVDEDQDTQTVKSEVSEQLSSNIAKLELEMKAALAERMDAMTQQCSNKAAEEISKRQIDVLRTNKVFRDISRPLGAKWPPVFEGLLSHLPSDVVHAERLKIEQDKPILQPYKALMAWKDLSGPDFNLRNIIEVLRSNDLDDLADTALQILDNKETDSLIDLSCIGKNLKSDNSSSSTASFKPTATGGATGSSSSISKTVSSCKKIDPEDVLDDRHLLMLAKRLGSDWEPLGKALNISDEELAEVVAGEGKTYQGGFKMLWNWRDATTISTQSLDSLIVALKQLGHQDVIDSVLR